MRADLIAALERIVASDGDYYTDAPECAESVSRLRGAIRDAAMFLMGVGDAPGSLVRIPCCDDSRGMIGGECDSCDGLIHPTIEEARRMQRANYLRTRALRVIVEDVKIRSWLEANDPKALQQCREALSEREQGGSRNG